MRSPPYCCGKNFSQVSKILKKEAVKGVGECIDFYYRNHGQIKKKKFLQKGGGGIGCSQEASQKDQKCEGQKDGITNSGVASFYFILAQTNSELSKCPASKAFTRFIIDHDTSRVIPGCVCVGQAFPA